MRWPWRKIRRANIPAEVRDELERYGENVIALMITGGFAPQSTMLHRFIQRAGNVEHAEAWLTERGDIHERREDRLETLEWAILVFVALEVLQPHGLLNWLWVRLSTLV